METFQKRGDNFIFVVGRRTFGSSVDQVPYRLAEFEASTMRYEAEPNVDALSDAIKKAVLVRGCNLQTYQSNSSVRNAVQSCTEAKRTWRSETVQASSSTDMEVDAVGKDGNKGKSKGGKGEEEKKKVMCFICGRRGHGQKDCWHKDTKGKTGKGKFIGKGKQKGKGKDKNHPVTEVRQDDSQSSNGSQMVANFTTDWIFAVTWADNWEETP